MCVSTSEGDSDPEDLHYFVYVLAQISGRSWVSTPAPEHANRSVRSTWQAAPGSTWLDHPGPYEAALIEPFHEQAQPISILKHDLADLRLLTPEGEEVPA